MIGNRYELQETLGQGGVGTVYKALDRLTGRVVALKQMRLSGYEDNEVWLSLAREFKVLASLRHPYIISVLDYGFDSRRQPYFTMPLLQRAHTIIRASRDLDAAGKIRLLIQLLQALAYLHRRGILHRDLKPGNVMVEAGRHVRVLDFGLAGEMQREIEIAGTISYLAPEILQGNQPTAAADLYSVGVIAYELFARHHPFVADNISTLMMQILTTSPDLSPLEHWKTPGLKMEVSPDSPTDNPIEQKYLQDHEAPTNQEFELSEGLHSIELKGADGASESVDSLAEVISKLLVKNPTARYQNATEVINDLCAVTGYPLPTESMAIRESFLQSAAFVGREREIRQLNEALRAILVLPDRERDRTPRVLPGTRPLPPLENAKPEGSAWLIGGETGVGKSRLMEEIRTRALVAGALVVRGQSVQDGRLPYHLWREPLRQLVLTAPLDEMTAAVLREVIPDISGLLRHPVPYAPRMEGKKTRRRLIMAIMQLLHQQQRPIVLLLEDLQWAEESLAPLQHIIRVVKNLPLLIVATYRTDETPDLPNLLPEMHFIELPRLSRDQISELGRVMIGETGNEDEVVEFLHRETEGNVLFLVEVIRALAEDAGGLEQVGQRTLPPQVFAGGIQRIVQQRLSRIAPDYYDMVKVAAVAGRRLDLDMLEAARNIPLDPGFFNELWVDAESQTSAEPQVPAIPFLLPPLPPLNPELNPGDFVDDWVDIEPLELPVEVPEVVKANGAHGGEPGFADDEWQDVVSGEQRRTRFLFSLQEWLFACTEASILEVRDDSWQFAHDKIRETVLVHLDDNELPGLHQQVARAIETVYPHDPAQIDRLREHWRQAGNTEREIYYTRQAARQAMDLGHFRRIRDMGDRAIELLKQEGGQTMEMMLLLAMLGRAHSYLGEYRKARLRYQASHEIARLNENAEAEIEAYLGLGRVAYLQHEYTEARNHWEESLLCSHETGYSSGTAKSLTHLGMLELEQGNHQVARTYLRESLAISREIEDRHGIAEALNNLGRVVWQQGDTGTAYTCYQESLSLYQEAGDRHGMAESMYHLGQVSGDMGQVELALEYTREALTIYRESGDLQGIASSLLYTGIIARRQEDLATADACATEGLEIMREIGSRPGIARCFNLMAQIAYHRENYVEALAHSEKSLNLHREDNQWRELTRGLCWNAMIKLAILDTRSAHARLQDALKMARANGDRMAILMALVGYARLYETRRQFQESATLINFVLSHPMGKSDALQEWITPIWESLSTRMNIAAFRRTMVRGRVNLSFEPAIQDLLQENQ